MPERAKRQGSQQWRSFMMLLFVGTAFLGCEKSAEDSPSSFDKTVENPRGATEEARLLPGPGNRKALEAVYDYSDLKKFEATAVTTPDERGLTIDRSYLEIRFKRHSTVNQVNGVLRSIHASIFWMIDGENILHVRIPDPGSYDALMEVEEIVSSSPFIEFVDHAFITPGPEGFNGKHKHH